MKVICGVLGMVAACSSQHAPADAIENASACPADPGTVSTIASGTLVGADATRVFFQVPSAPGLMAWPRGGGVATRFTSEDLGTSLTISGATYYWTSPAATAIHVTDASGQILRTVPLASAPNAVKQLAPAADGGVYVLTGCHGACTPAPPDTIELVSGGAVASHTIVTGPTSIGAIAATGDGLLWAEAGPFGDPVRIQRRDAATGEVTTLVAGAALDTQVGGLLIAGRELFDVAYGPSAPEYKRVIERRDLADGRLLDSYAAPDYSITPVFSFGGPPQWLTLDTDLYWTEQRGSVLALPSGLCGVPTGLFRIGLADRTSASIDPFALPLPPAVDQDFVYYAYAYVTACCVGHGIQCNDPPGPAEVRCFRRPHAGP